MKPNIERSKDAISLIWLVMVVYIITGLFDAFYEWEQDVYTYSGIFYQIVFLISVLFFLRWFRRAYYNLHRKFDSLSFQEGWSIGVWFIPIFNLIGPYEIMKELFVKTGDYLEEQGVEDTKLVSAKIVKIWWALWLFWAIHEIVIFSPRFSSMLSMQILEILSIFIFVILSLSTIRLIKNYRQMEILFHEIQ